ncbi:hypothetical protein BHE74_00029931 [Ensete ventricosum]|nr:hypothetical protein GW17_00046023 [Ensete ventricosum]RWW62928.1 hypothetical protein BHE74_00029931 [Ensete ventricosum]
MQSASIRYRESNKGANWMAGFARTLRSSFLCTVFLDVFVQFFCPFRCRGELLLS